MRTSRDSTLAGRGFSLAELVIVMAIAAAVITAGVLAYQAVTSVSSLRSAFGPVTIGQPRMENFYEIEAASLDAFYAPNYGRAVLATRLQELLMEDLMASVAVFCLGRDSLNTVRPLEIPVAADFDFRSLDSPNAFRQVLSVAFPDAATIFVPYRGASPSQSATLFLLRPSGVEEALWIHSIYEIDILETADPEGVFASVRRYEAGVLTDFYDVFFPDENLDEPFLPVIACFERRSLRATVEAEEVDAFKAAAERPFYFVWWPDPALPRIEPHGDEEFDDDDPRAAYAAMGGRTAFFTVVPMFPAL